MVEQPALKFITFDVDAEGAAAHPSSTTRTSRNILGALTRADADGEDHEFAQRDGVVHVSRYAPDDALNEAFRQKQGLQMRRLPLGEVGPAQLAIGIDGQLDSLFFRQLLMPASAQPLGPDDVEVEVCAVGLNAKDYFAITGRVNTRDATCTLEHCGVVIRTGCSGADAGGLRPGDRVVVMAPGKFRTTEIVPR